MKYFKPSATKLVSSTSIGWISLFVKILTNKEELNQKFLKNQTYKATRPVFYVASLIVDH